jgi:predicted RNA-binding protein
LEPETWNLEPQNPEDFGMCNESAFVLYHKDGHRHLAEIDLIEVDEASIRLKDMNGNETFLPGRIRTIDLVNRRIETTE